MKRPTKLELALVNPARSKRLRKENGDPPISSAEINARVFNHRFALEVAKPEAVKLRLAAQEFALPRDNVIDHKTGDDVLGERRNEALLFAALNFARAYRGES